MRKYLLQFTVCFIIGLLIFTSCSKQEKASDEPKVESSVHDSLAIEMVGEDGMTAFDILNEQHEVGYQSSAMGVFVKMIDSVEIGDGYYWLYSVNDSMAQEAADKLVTKSGDKIVWYFRNPNK